MVRRVGPAAVAMGPAYPRTSHAQLSSPVSGGVALLDSPAGRTVCFVVAAAAVTYCARKVRARVASVVGWMPAVQVSLAAGAGDATTASLASSCQDPAQNILNKNLNN